MLVAPKEFYVYTVRISNETQPFYVGKGYGKRIGEHVRQAKRNHKSLKCSKIRKALALGYHIITEKVFTSFDEQACFAVERELICHYGRRDIGTGILANETDEGAPFAYWTPRKRRNQTAHRRKQQRQGYYEAAASANFNHSKRT